MSKKIKQNKKMQKGFSFTFDGLIAAMIIFGVIGFIAAGSIGAHEFSSQKVVQKQLADDILETAIDLNKFQGENSGETEGIILATLPTNYTYQLIIRKYNPINLSLTSTSTYGSSLDTNNSKYVETKKMFSNYYQSDVNAFYSATLRLWLR